MTHEEMVAKVREIVGENGTPVPAPSSPERLLEYIETICRVVLKPGASTGPLVAVELIGELIDDAEPFIKTPTVGASMGAAAKYGRIIEFQAPCLGHGDEPCLHWFQFWPSIGGISEDWTCRMYDGGAWEKRADLNSVAIDDLRRECRIVSVEEADENPGERF